MIEGFIFTFWHLNCPPKQRNFSHPTDTNMDHCALQNPSIFFLLSLKQNWWCTNNKSVEKTEKSPRFPLLNSFCWWRLKLARIYLYGYLHLTRKIQDAVCLLEKIDIHNRAELIMKSSVYFDFVNLKGMSFF